MKRLELHFSGDDLVVGMSPRHLDFESLEPVPHAMQCTVVSPVRNRYFDAHVLSESSLFVYPTKIIIQTCGITLLLKSIPPLLRHGRHMGLCGLRTYQAYFRKDFRMMGSAFVGNSKLCGEPLKPCDSRELIRRARAKTSLNGFSTLGGCFYTMMRRDPTAWFAWPLLGHMSFAFVSSLFF
ncbi:hypothetical protein AAG906_029566 [Vitis piasezkii]